MVVYDAHGPSFSWKGPPRPCSIFLRRWPAFGSGVDLWTLLVAGFERGIGARRQSIMLSGGQLFGGGRGDGGVVVAEMSRTSMPVLPLSRQAGKSRKTLELSPSTQGQLDAHCASRRGGREGRGDERERPRKIQISKATNLLLHEAGKKSMFPARTVCAEGKSQFNGSAS